MNSAECEARINGLLDDNRKLREELKRAKLALANIQLITSGALMSFDPPAQEMPDHLRPALVYPP